MKCPYCDDEMIPGALYSEGDSAVYWLPNSAPRDFHFLNRKNIESRNGILVDDITKIGFFAKARPYSYYCKGCKTFITKLP